MHDLVNNKLPGSYDDFIPITNESNYDITTIHRNRLYIPGPGLHFLRIYQIITLQIFGTSSIKSIKHANQKKKLRNFYVNNS